MQEAAYFDGEPAGARTGQVEGSIHQRDMRKRLGKISHQAPGPGVVFLGEQTNVVGQRQYPLEKLFCIGVTPLQLERTHHPETAGEKDSFAGRQAIRHFLRVVPQHQSAGHQVVLNRLERALDPRILRREETPS